jgi:hypothetical protein
MDGSIPLIAKAVPQESARECRTDASEPDGEARESPHRLIDLEHARGRERMTADSGSV